MVGVHIMVWYGTSLVPYNTIPYISSIYHIYVCYIVPPLKQVCGVRFVTCDLIFKIQTPDCDVT